MAGCTRPNCTLTRLNIYFSCIDPLLICLCYEYSQNMVTSPIVCINVAFAKREDAKKSAHNWPNALLSITTAVQNKCLQKSAKSEGAKRWP